VTAGIVAAAGALLRSGFGWRPAGIGIPLWLEHDGVRAHVTADRTAFGWRLRGDLACDVPFDGPVVLAAGSAVVVAPPPSAHAARAGKSMGTGSVRAPMPGKIVSVAAQPGETVELHDVLVVLEAMKMEHRIEAPAAGTVGAVHVVPGDVVAAGAELVTIGAA
jgi:biotin carboxyl carrier protein